MWHGLVLRRRWRPYPSGMSTSKQTATPISRDIVIVEGSDARGYLNTQLTQDIMAIGLGESAWSFLLDPKSSIVALVRVTRIGQDRITLDVEPGYGDAVRGRLDGLLFRTDARFSQATWPGVSWHGPGSAAQVADAPIVSRSPWAGVDGLDVVGPTVSVPSGTDRLSEDELEAMRIEAGWPAMGKEIIDGITPAMTGLVELTVSFDKGCYTGQELVARVHHRGAAPTKRLVGIQTGEHAVSAGQEFSIDGDVAGFVTSSSGSEALGYLARKFETPQDVLVGDAPAKVLSLV